MSHSFSANYYAYSSWQGSSGGGVNDSSDVISNTKYARFKDFFGLALLCFMPVAPILGAAIGGVAQIIQGPLVDTIHTTDSFTGIPITYIKETSRVGMGAFFGLVTWLGVGISSGIGLAVMESSICIYKKSKAYILEKKSPVEEEVIEEKMQVFIKKSNKKENIILNDIDNLDNNILNPPKNLSPKRKNKH